MLFIERNIKKVNGDNWLGTEWAKKIQRFYSNSDLYGFPSLYEIFMGIMAEAEVQLRLNSGCPDGSELLQVAIKNHCDEW
jgi:hypothetical protein